MMFLLIFCVFGFLYDNTDAVVCGPGNYLDGTGGCVPCAKNTFSDRNNSRSCQHCLPESVTETTGAKSFFDCQCKAGYGRFMPFEPCMRCPAGEYNDGTLNTTMFPREARGPNRGICLFCPNGTTTLDMGATSAANCSSCRPGYYKRGTSCLPCAKGSYSQDIDSTSCTDCPRGETTSAEGSDNRMACHKQCSAGEYWRYGWCRNCPIGTYAEAGKDDRCESCPKGLSTPRTGSTSAADCTVCDHGLVMVGTSCVGCPVGKYYSSGRCTSCPTGKTTLKEGATGESDCVCAAGYEGDRRWSWGRYRTACNACPVGTYSDTAGSSTCTNCPSGLTTMSTGQTAASSCVCESGTIMDSNDQVCVRCGNGTYSTAGAADCTVCPTGSTTLREGASHASECACLPGYFNNPATGACQVCPANSYSDQLRARICTLCPPGKTVSTDRTTCL